MTQRQTDHAEITPEVLLRAYAVGIFPMAENADDPTLFWVEPERRGVIPLEGFHVPSRLARTVRSGEFTVTANRAFDDVMARCAASVPDRRETWINARIRTLYGALHRMGHGHSIEAWQDGKLVGGLYGVSLGAAFFGESMFHESRDASKVALVHLVARLMRSGFRLLDTQYVTDHLKTFGAMEVPRKRYRTMLDEATARDASVEQLIAGELSGERALEIIASRLK